MTGLTILIIGIPAALFRFALSRFHRQSGEVVEVEPVFASCWDGFEAARLNHPPLSEMEVRP